MVLKLFQNRFAPALVILISLPLVIPLLHPGIPITADGIAHLFRQANYHQALLDGQIPPRWEPIAIHHLGVPTFLYNWFLPYLINEIPIFLGFSIQSSAKIFDIFCLIFAPLGMYYMIKSITQNPLAALLSAVLYAWAPYRLMEIFRYGAWGEILALTLAPYLALYLYKLTSHSGSKTILIVAGLTALLILSHNLSAIIFLPFLLLFSFFFRPAVKLAARLIFATITGIGLSAFFWLPAAIESPLIRYNFDQLFGFGISEHFPSLLNNLTLTLSQFYSASPQVLWNEFTLGLPILLSAVITLAILLTHPHQPTAKVIVLALAFGIVSYLLTLNVSLNLWMQTPLKIIVYPYRFLAPATFFLVLSLGMAVSSLPPQALKVALLLAFPITFRAGLPYLNIINGYINADSVYTSQVNPSLFAPQTGVIMGTMEFLPQTASDPFVRNLDSIVAGQNLPRLAPDNPGWTNWSNLTDKTNLLSFNYASPTPLAVTINTLYFPNWHAKIDDQPFPVAPDDVGRIRLLLPSASSPSTVTLYWQTSPVEWLGIAISVVSLISFPFLPKLLKSLK